MTVSLKINNRRRNLLVILIFCIIVVTVALNITVDFYVRHFMRTVRLNFRQASGCLLEIGDAHFNILHGVTLRNIAIRSVEQPLLHIQYAAVQLDPFTLIIKRQPRCTKITIADGIIFSDIRYDSAAWPVFLRALKDGGFLLQSTKVNLIRCIFPGKLNINMDGYIAIAQGKTLLTRGKLFINSAAFLKVKKANYKSSLLNRRIDYTFESSFSDTSFTINKFDIHSDETRCIISGGVEEHDRIPMLALRGNINNVLLEDIQPLNNGFFRTQGILGIDFILKGPLDNITFEAGANIESGSLSVVDALTIKKIRTQLAWDNHWFKIKEMNGTIDGAPVTLSMSLNTKKASRFEVQCTAKRIGSLRDIAVFIMFVSRSTPKVITPSGS